MEYFLNTNALLALARIHALNNHVGKVTCDVGGSTDPVFTKQACKESQMAFTKKGKTAMLDDFEVGRENEFESLKWVFCPTLPF